MCVICMRKAVDPIIIMRLAVRYLRCAMADAATSDYRLTDMPYNYTLQTTYLKLRLASRKSDVDRGTRNLEARGEREDRRPPHPVL